MSHPSFPSRRPLRIPAGWCIEYHEWYEGPLGDTELQQDLLLARHATRDRIVDLSWYHGDADSGRYRLTMWSGAEPGTLLVASEFADATTATHAVERLLLEVSLGR